MNPMPVQRFGWKKTLVYSFLPLIMLLGLLEAAGRAVEWFVPPLPADYGLGFNEGSRLFERAGWFSKFMRTAAPKRAFWFIDEYFVHPKPEEEVRIAVVGGSNVNFLEPAFWALEKRYKGRKGDPYINVINCGGMSYGSGRLRRIVQEILPYDLDLMVLYLGHNEFEEMKQRRLASPERVWLQKLLYSSAACRVVSDLWARRVQRQLEAEAAHTQAGLAGPGSLVRLQLTPEMQAERMRVFEQNLTAMVRMAKEQRVPVVIGTLATSYWEPDLRGGATDHYRPLRELYAEGKYEEGLALCKRILGENTRFQACEIENGIIRRVAEAENIPLVDIAAAITAAEPHGVMGETLMQDECHLNDAGRAIWMEAFFPFIAHAWEAGQTGGQK